MKASVIREMTTEEVQDKLNEQSEGLHKLKLSNSVSQLENPMQLNLLRKDIARLKTDLTRRKIEAQNS